jgi:hypothetical protein
MATDTSQSYTLNFTDTSKTITVPAMTINGPIAAGSTDVYPNTSGSSTSIGLVGRGEQNYGRIILNNLLQMLEHFSSPTAPTNPVAGQLWHNSSTNALSLYTGTDWIDVIGTTQFVSKSGDVMEGNLTFPSTHTLLLNYVPSAQTHAINKLYGDTTYVSKSGAQMSGDLEFPTGTKPTVADLPSVGIDVANKQYVDLAVAGVSLTSNRVEKINSGSANIKFGTPLSALGADGVQLSVASDSFATSQVFGLSNNISNSSSVNVNIQSYGTLIGTTTEWDQVTGTVGGLQVGKDYYISIIPGMLTTTPTTTPTFYMTKVGTAMSTTTMSIAIQSPFRL